MGFEVRNKLDTKKAVEFAVFDGNTVIGIGTVAQAKALCPVNKDPKAKTPGRLRNSIGFKQPGKEIGAEPLKEVTPNRKQIFVGTSVEYGPYVEFGVKSRPKYPIQPYLRPAISVIDALLNGQVKETVNRVFKEFERLAKSGT